MSKKSFKTTSSEDEERIRRVLADIEVRVRKLFEEQGSTLHEIEIDAGKVGKEITEVLTEEKIKKIASAPCDYKIKCQCMRRQEGKARLQCVEAGFSDLEPCLIMARRSKHPQTRKVITLHGHITFGRFYFYCRKCKHGFCPADIQLGIASRDTSRAVQAHACRISSYLPASRASDELFAFTGIKLSASSIDNFAKSAGRSISEHCTASSVRVSSGDLVAPIFSNRDYYISMDAFKAHVGGVWRDAKLGVIYCRNEKGRVDDRAYYASFERSVDFGPQVLALAHRFGMGANDVVQALGDGAEWIWIEFKKAFPWAIQTLDFYHFLEHLGTLAKARFSGNTEKVDKCLSLQRKNLLVHGDLELVVKDIDRWKPTGESNKKLKQNTLNYITANRSRTRYKQLREDGFDIGSGIVEAGCKTMKARIGGPGMRWEEPGAAAILHLTSLFHTSAEPDFLPYTHN